MQKTSARGLAEIAFHEGLVLSPYLDSVGVWTLGIGHTASAGDPDPAREKRAFSVAEIMEIFARDVARFEARVRKAFRRALTQAQFDAAVSFDFNTGGIDRASWVDHFNDGNDVLASTAFMKWRKPASIIPRRQKEHDLFFEGHYSGDGTVNVYQATRTGEVMWSKGRRMTLPADGEAVRVPDKAVSEGNHPEANPTSKILPLYRPKQDDLITQAVLAKFAYLMPAARRLDAVKVLVVRGYYLNSMGRKGENDRALYDDAVFVVTPDGVQPFNGNSDPSVFRKRIATIKASQAIRYRPGLHGYKRKSGPYPAFRQDADCTVSRDGAGDDHGMHHVNLHRGGVTGTSSLGCLTIPPHQWDEFHKLVNGLLDKHGQDTFFVTLVEYPGGQPPVERPDAETDTASSAKPSGGAAVAIAIAASGGLIASWWEKLTSFIGGLF